MGGGGGVSLFIALVAICKRPPISAAVWIIYKKLFNLYFFGIKIKRDGGLQESRFFMKLKVTINEKKIESFCKKHHIRKLSLFGSVLTNTFKRTSDVDFLVYFDKKHIPGLFGIASMERELSEIIGRKADLRTPFDLSPYFREEVIAEAKCIYGKT